MKRNQNLTIAFIILACVLLLTNVSADDSDNVENPFPSIYWPLFARKLSLTE